MEPLRLTSETKTINGSGLFRTQNGYNVADMPAWTKYPGDNAANIGEKVTYGYSSQGSLNTLQSITNNYYYVNSTIYDSAGRLNQRWLGAATQAATPVIVSNYAYYAWSTQGQGGRLRYLTSGLYADPDSLQSFEYNYDSGGNINWIKDYNTGGMQTQTFTYDNLNRLISAAASGGTGGTYNSETYDYSNSTGNLASKAGSSYAYGAQSASCPGGPLSKAHAVVSVGTNNTYCYDLNGNMVKRVVGTQTFTLGYNAENQMTSVSGAASATFTYDGNGARVKGVVGSATTVYISNYFEWTGSTATMIKYYYAGAARVAMRTGNTTQQTANLNYLLADHLGSTGKTADAAGATIGEQRYKAWGETRFSSGTVATTFQYTGQRNQVEIGLYFYGARWWDPALGRFTSADTIIPEASQGVQAWDRYAGMNNNAVRYNDPSGHCIDEGDAPPGATRNNICPKPDPIKSIINKTRLGGEQYQAVFSIAFPFDDPNHEDSLLSGTNFVTFGLSLVVNHRTGEVGLFLITRDSGIIKGNDGRWRRDPGPAEQKIGESMMTPGGGVTFSKGYMGGEKFSEGLESAYRGSSISVEVSGSLLAGDGWAGIDDEGDFSGVGGVDLGVGFGTPGAGLIALNAAKIIITPRLWRR